MYYEKCWDRKYWILPTVFFWLMDGPRGGIFFLHPESLDTFLEKFQKENKIYADKHFRYLFLYFCHEILSFKYLIVTARRFGEKVNRKFTNLSFCCWRNQQEDIWETVIW